MPNSEAKAQARALILSMAFLLAGAAFIAQPVSAESFNNVQVFASSASTQAYNFQFAAYNLTGSLIASYQTPYPAAAFELPTGWYLFTVSATHLGPFMEYPCPIMAGSVSGGSVSPGRTMPYNGSGTATPMPVACRPPSSEYGYSISNISGSQTVNIGMQNVTALPTTSATVRVSYVNGTAAAGASVYASVVGEWYFWWQDASITMGAQTDSNGIAHLVLPAAPAVVTAWKWVPIFSGKNGTTIETTVGGQKVNVTVYWQPTYVGLSGSGLLLPPGNIINLTLHYQQPNYWVMPAGVASKGAYVGGAPTATVASQPNGTPSLAPTSSGAESSSQYYLPSQIPAIELAGGAESSVSGQAGLFSMETIAATVVFAAVALLVVLAARHRTNKPSSQAG